MPDTAIWAPITKVDKATREIEGPISGPDNLDLDQQIVDTAFIRRAVGPWFTFGNIREQHKVDRAVGKATEANLNTPDGVPFIRAKIVDDAAWAKVEAGVYSGFSVGIKNARIVSDPAAPRGRIVDGDLIEVSIVDHPANPMAKFAVCKGLGTGRWEDSQTGLELGSVAQPITQTPAIGFPGGNPFSNPAALLALDKSTIPDQAPVAVTADVAKEMPQTVRSKYQESTDEHFSNYKQTVRHEGKTHQVENHTHFHDNGTNSHSHPHIHPNGRPDHFRYGAHANHEDHSHCAQCGSDDKVCGHGMQDNPEKVAMPQTNKDAAVTPTNDENNVTSPSEADAAALAEQKRKDDELAAKANQQQGQTANADQPPTNQQVADAGAATVQPTAPNPVVNASADPDANKGVEPDVTKDKAGLPSLATPRGGTATVPSTSPITDQHRSIDDLMKDATNALNALMREVGGKKTGELPINNAGPVTRDAEFQGVHKQPPTDWHGKDMFDIKAAVREALDEMLPAALAKAVGVGDDVITKGVGPDTVKAAVENVAKSAAQTVLEDVNTRLMNVEALGAPLVGAANTDALPVNKSFGRNPDGTIDEAAIIKATETMTEDQRMEVVKAAVAYAQQHPGKALFTPNGISQ